MLAKKQKLNSVEFTDAFEGGQTIHTNFFTLKHLKNQDGFKAAAVVSKKHTKTAIKRNYRRRVIYNILKKLHHQDVVPNHSHLVVILKKSALDVAPTILEQDLEEVIQHIKQKETSRHER